MKTTEIAGFKRVDFGTKFSTKLRAEGNVPGVLYGGEEPLHFYVPMYLFRELLYSPDAYIINLNIEGIKKRCVLQDAQFHPVSDMILHVDFVEIFEDRPVVIDIPVRLTGTAPGVLAGGQLDQKSKRLKVKALPADLPDYVTVNISSLEVGQTIKVKDIEAGKFSILNSGNVSVVSVNITRALRQAAASN